MLKYEIKQKLLELCKKDNSDILFDHPFCDNSTISIGGKVAAWYTPASIEGLKEVKRYLKEKKIRTIVTGAGSNVLIDDEGLAAAVINLSAGSFTEIVREDNLVEAGAGVRLSALISYCCKNGLAGLEGLVGIPATVGGMLAMNASYFEAISDHLLKVVILDAALEEKVVPKRDIEFGYRFSSFDEGTIILKAFFDLLEAPADQVKEKTSEYLADKKSKQPLEKKTLGCVFKNPPEGMTAGELIDKCGMKGLILGGAQVSKKHANFIVNIGGATSKDVIDLMNEIRAKVSEKFSVVLEPEIEILKNG